MDPFIVTAISAFGVYTLGMIVLTVQLTRESKQKLEESMQFFAQIREQENLALDRADAKVIEAKQPEAQKAKDQKATVQEVAALLTAD